MHLRPMVTDWRDLQATVNFEKVNIMAPDGRVGTLVRFVDTEKRAWFSVREASNLLLDECTAGRDCLRRQCRAELLRPATVVETNILREVVTAAGLREAVQNLGFFNTAECIQVEPTEAPVGLLPFLSEFIPIYHLLSLSVSLSVCPARLSLPLS